MTPIDRPGHRTPRPITAERTSPTDIVVTPLTKTEKRVLEQVSLGQDPAAGAAELGMTRPTFNDHVRHIGHKFQVKGPAVKLQMAYVMQQLDLPDPIECTEEFSDEERNLWQAIALHSVPVDISVAAGHGPHGVPGMSEAIKGLMRKTGARSQAHLVRLGHAFGVLDATAPPPPIAL
ncbi:helix-turn-helix transcriptional regulator [Streptomyces cyaneofuscatus]|uniref:helix-turn-helix transcriptional regulator n=1 Tax=Streptomyces cyaneofuscatus TaxID=66883 RepID=UPI003CF2284F